MLPVPVQRKGPMIRVTITVPQEVRERMDQFAGYTNWSSIATEAFVQWMDSQDIAGTIWADHSCREILL